MPYNSSGRAGRATASRIWLLAAFAVLALAASGFAASAASAETTWLCKPGIAANPCASDETATVELGNGKSFVEHAKPAKNPPIDCFYVYPTVSSQIGPNANLEIDPEETQVAIDQVSRLSQVCKVYAPIYPQITIPALNTPGAVTPEVSAKAYIGMAEAFAEYIARFNKGRGFILVGHSQGALLLKRLIQEQFDPSTAQGQALRHLLDGADLLGGNVLVPKGKTVGGDFQHVPACSFAGQTHCVVAYSSFLQEPPNPANFGRVESPLLGMGAGPSEEQVNNDEVLCVNPAVAIQANNHVSGAMLRYESTTPFPGLLGPFIQAPSAPTPWVAFPGQYSGMCRSANGATWLQLTPAGPAGDPRPAIVEALGPLWGTHLEDVAVGLGNLVINSALQAGNYLVTH
jgi:hypothetical protein